VLREIEATQKWLTMLRRKWKDLRRTREQLESNPADGTAHRKMGAFYCFAKEDWKRGIPHLARGSDSELRQIAQLELNRPSDAAVRFHLGKKWLEAADAARDTKDARVMRLRARYWFLKAGAGTKKSTVRRAVNSQLEKITLYPTRIVIWNTHNAMHGDRGTLECHLVLVNGGQTVSAGKLQLPWSAERNMPYVAILAGKPVDEVRIEVTRWPRNGGGLAEVQIFQGRTNLATGCEVRASASFREGFTHDNLTDGITGATEEKFSKGYWLLPHKTKGWCSFHLDKAK